MSKIGKKPIEIPQGVTVTIADGVVSVSGPKGQVKLPVLAWINVSMEGTQLTLGTDKNIKQATANWGTMRALIQNAIIGVTEGFKKVLEIEGVGFRATMEGKTLVLNIGFSHPVRYESPEGITIVTEKGMVTVSGIDRQMVGQVAAHIRKFKKPEPYKGKGIHYQGEVVRRKAGKKVAK
jgi:large subunit ribosomal protein L6